MHVGVVSPKSPNMDRRFRPSYWSCALLLFLPLLPCFPLLLLFLLPLSLLLFFLLRMQKLIVVVRKLCGIDNGGN